MSYTNNCNIPLSLAIWLTHDTYDHDPDPDVISVTTLLKPLRAIVLSRTLSSDRAIDLMDLVPSKMGTAIHEAIEKAWDSDIYLSTLESVGIPTALAERIQINPEHPVASDYNIYIERRSKRKMGKFTLSGKLDIVLDGRVEDFKSTSVWNWIFQSNKDDYIFQESMYKFLNQDIITSDICAINYIFTDWSAADSRKNKDYPKHKIMTRNYSLMSLEATEEYVQTRFNAIEQLELLPLTSLPLCTKEELWQGDTLWKYYKNPNSTARSTKNFDTAGAAHARMSSDGNIGIVREVKAKAKRCNYCNAAPVCSQKTDMELAGLL